MSMENEALDNSLGYILCEIEAGDSILCWCCHLVLQIEALQC
jgi:hypothetical protein